MSARRLGPKHRCPDLDDIFRTVVKRPLLEVRYRGGGDALSSICDCSAEVAAFPPLVVPELNFVADGYSEDASPGVTLEELAHRQVTGFDTWRAVRASVLGQQPVHDDLPGSRIGRRGIVTCFVDVGIGILSEHRAIDLAVSDCRRVELGEDL